MKKKLLLVSIFSLGLLFGTHLQAALDTIPLSKKLKGIQIMLNSAYEGDSQGAQFLSAFSINDLTRSQIDSFVYALQNEKLEGKRAMFYLALTAGLWHLDRKDVHRRLCQFITLDTLDYAGRWGENRRPKYDGQEWAARLALARLGYHYHIDFIEHILEDRSLFGRTTSTMLALYTQYIDQPQITNFLLELALKDYYYCYQDDWNNGGDTLTYYLSQDIMSKTGLSIDVPEEESYPRKWRPYITEADIAQFKQWIKASRGRNIKLKEDSLLVRDGGFFASYISIWPNAHIRAQRAKALKESIRQYKLVSKNSPHINYLGACYFEGDTILVDRNKMDRMWLMAWQNDQHIMDTKVTWKGISAIQKSTYARLDKKLIPQRRRHRVSVRCSGCGERGRDVSVSVWVMNRR